MKGTDDVLETLLLPFTNGQLQWSNDAVFLRARFGSSLAQLASKDLICEQSFKPEAEGLERAGFNVSPELPGVTHESDSKADNQPVHPEFIEGLREKNQNGSTGSPRTDQSRSNRNFSIALILPPRQRDEARALFARAISLTRSGGIVIAAVSNNEGARSLESDLEKLAGSINTLSKNKCRVFWCVSQPETVNQSLLSEWAQLDKPRSILNGKFTSRPGVFAWDRVDVASALLAQHLPTSLHGAAADLGAGYGYLSDALLMKCPGITTLAVYEAEHRALQLAKINLAEHQPQHHIHYCWQDVTAGLPEKYDVIVTNPPFHAQGSRDRPDIGRRFITVAAQSLNAGGQLWLVANRHLPYEAALAEGFESVNVITQQQGFKIVAATRAPAVMSRDAATGRRARK